MQTAATTWENRSGAYRGAICRKAPDDFDGAREFKGVTGTVTWDDQDVTKSKVDVTIDAKKP